MVFWFFTESILSISKSMISYFKFLNLSLLYYANKISIKFYLTVITYILLTFNALLIFSISSLYSHPQFWQHFEIRLFNYYFVSMVHKRIPLSTATAQKWMSDTLPTYFQGDHWMKRAYVFSFYFFTQIPCLGGKRFWSCGWMSREWNL